MVLTPMVSSVETRMVSDKIEDKIYNLFLKKELLVDLFKNIYDMFKIKDVINIIFLILLLPIFYLIFYISMWGDWSYFNLIEFIELYFSIIYAILDYFFPFF